jgi:hypothetical protein
VSFLDVGWHFDLAVGLPIVVVGVLAFVLLGGGRP